MLQSLNSLKASTSFQQIHIIPMTVFQLNIKLSDPAPAMQAWGCEFDSNYQKKSLLCFRIALGMLNPSPIFLISALNLSIVLKPVVDYNLCEQIGHWPASTETCELSH